MPSDDEISPRGFAIKTGLVFIIVGTALFLGSCCLWSFSGFWISPDAEGTVPAVAPSSQDQAARLSAACMIVSFLGGIALLAAGVGLYGERPSGGPLGCFVTVSLAVLFAAAGGLALAGHSGWLQTLVPSAIALLMLSLVPLAAVSWQTLRRFPPPADQNVVSDKDLLNLKNRRRE